MADKGSVKVRAMALPEALGRDTKLGLTGWKLRLRPNKNRIRLVLGAVEAFGGFLSLGGAHDPRGGFWLFLCGFVVCAESARLDRVNAVVVGECAEAVQAILSGAQQLLEGDSKHAADETAVDRAEGS